MKLFFNIVAYLLGVQFRLGVTNTDSTQMAKITGQAAGSYAPLAPNELAGRLRVAYFDFTTLATGGADGDSYNLTRIPSGARILRIKTVNEALGTSVVAAIGISGSTSKYGAGLDLAAAGTDEDCLTVATYGLVTTAEENLIMTLTGAAPTASKIVKGHVQYVVD